MTKLALILMAGPEMPCKLAHGLLWALDIARNGGEAKIVFEGQSPRWLFALPGEEHPQHKLYVRLKGMGIIDGVCKGCATVNGALEAAQAEGLTLLADAGGHASLRAYLEGGFEIVML
jgi:hypothetical protein